MEAWGGAIEMGAGAPGMSLHATWWDKLVPRGGTSGRQLERLAQACGRWLLPLQDGKSLKETHEKLKSESIPSPTHPLTHPPKRVWLGVRPCFLWNTAVWALGVACFRPWA